MDPKTQKAAGNFIFALSFIVFLVLDFFDSVFCIIFRFLDEFLEGNVASRCYCENREEQGRSVTEVGESEVSETLFGNGRKNIFREMGFGLMRKQVDDKERGCGMVVNRWSDCGCESGVSWHNNGEQRLHVVAKEPSQDRIGRV